VERGAKILPSLAQLTRSLLDISNSLSEVDNCLDHKQSNSAADLSDSLKWTPLFRLWVPHFPFRIRRFGWTLR
jgi:hypothetical protein